MTNYRWIRSDNSPLVEGKSEGAKKVFAFFVNHPVAMETVEPFLKAIGASRCTVLVEDFGDSASLAAQRVMQARMPDLEIIQVSEALDSRRQWLVGVAIVPFGQIPEGLSSEIRLLSKRVRRRLVAWFWSLARGFRSLFLPSSVRAMASPTDMRRGDSSANGRRLLADWKPMRRLFRTSVKLEHGIYDVSGYNFGPTNRMFDAVLCHGPYSQQRYRKNFGLRSICVDYPKYAPSLSLLSDKDQKPKSAVGRRKPVVLWLPSLHQENSIEKFAEEVSSLAPDFDVFVKPHPMSPEPQIAALRRSRVPEVPPDWPQTLPDLFQIADCTIHDVGGTGFAALYLRKNPLFLRIPDSIVVENGATIPEKLLGKHFGEIEPCELRAAVLHALSREAETGAWADSTEALRSRFFSGGGLEDTLAGSEYLGRLAAETRFVRSFLNSRSAKRLRAMYWTLKLARSHPKVIE